MRHWGSEWLALVGCVAIVVPACGHSSSAKDGGYTASEGAGAAAGIDGVPPLLSDSSEEPGVTGVAEVEADIEFELPHAGERYVYAVNPDSDTVAVIDAATLAIHTIPAGERPRYLQTLAGTDAAIVLNVDSNDATVIRTENGESAYWNVDVRLGANAIAVAPDGKHAVVYYDARFNSGGITSGNFQDVTLLTLDQSSVSATDMTVGYRPSAVHFDSAGTHAYVVTDNGVSIIDFSAVAEEGSGQALTLSMGDGVDDPGTDVSVTEDGRYAVAQQGSNRQLRLVDLDSHSSQVLDVVQLIDDALASQSAGSAGASSSPSESLVPTSDGVPAVDLLSDVDLSPDSQFVVAVVRYAGAVVKIPVPSGFSDPSLAEITWISGGRIGQVLLTDDGARGVLFTTADPEDERLTTLDFLSNTPPTVVDLHKAVSQVAISPDGSTAFVVHQPTNGNPADTEQEQLVDRSHGYSLVNLNTGFPKLEVTADAVQSFALVPDANSVFISFQNPTEVHRVGLSDFVQSTIVLASTPVAIGSVPQSKKVFVSQAHPDGRITFIDWESLSINTVTGFELNSSISESR